jgi:hypothetical protein
MKLRPLDWFALVGTVLFVLSAGLVQWNRWLESRGPGNAAEFFLYAVIIQAGIVLLWLAFRRYPWRPSTLAMIAAGILVHFIAGLMGHGGVRVYDVVVLGVRFDKIVHVVNAFMAVRITAEIFRFEGLRLGRMERLIVVLVVLGLGTLWEMAEYLVLSSVPDAGVGYYHNTLQDQIANLIGAASSALVLPPGSDPATGEPEGGC